MTHPFHQLYLSHRETLFENSLTYIEKVSTFVIDYKPDATLACSVWKFQCLTEVILSSALHLGNLLLINSLSVIPSLGQEKDNSSDGIQ